MKVLCDRERLREALALVQSVVPSKSTRPAIENIYMVATDSALELVGTDLQISMRFALDDVKVEETGAALVPGRVTADFVRDLTSETVELSVDQEQLTIVGGEDTCTLSTTDPDEFPTAALMRFEAEGALSLQAGNFAKLVNRTAFAAAKEQGRYAMHGILTLVEDQSLRMVATDGRRLAVASMPIDDGDNPPKRAIVPTKAMQAFCRVIDDSLEQIRVHFADSQIGVRTKKAEIFARVIDGEFPRYAAVIPGEVKYSVEADAETLTRKLKLVSNVTTADARAVKLGLDGQRLTISGRSSASGRAESHMDVTFKGEDAEISFNPDFIVDGLRNCERDVVMLEFNDRTSPGKFTLGENYLYIVMPITADA
ncbi:MAG: DNA polymerase III subunit beta [Planctomycetota bacterium]